MAKIPLPPEEYMTFVGGKNDLAKAFIEIGQEFLGYFKNLANLSPDDNVLDIGCGCGRIAYPLTEYLSSKAIYEGFDVDPVMIDWCIKNIQSRKPNFHFQHLDIYNQFYTPDGILDSTEVIFLYPREAFDFACAISVFTHLYDREVIHYLEETYRVLKPGGTLFATFFIGHEVGGNTIQQTYTEEAIRRYYGATGFEITDIKYGHWLPRTVPTCSFQDIVIAKKLVGKSSMRSKKKKEKL